MSEVQQRTIVSIPEDLEDGDRVKLGNLIIDKILERTANNTDINGNRFANYSESYAKSLDFKIAGKKKDDPNLRLSNEMLDSLSILSHSTGRIEIGYSEGTDANDKAAWVQASDNGPSRRFLGISDSELEFLIAEVRVDIAEIQPQLSPEDQARERIAQEAAKQVVDSILNNLEFDTTEED